MPKKEESPLWFFLIFPAFFLGLVYIGGIIWDSYQNKSTPQTHYQKIKIDTLFKQVSQVLVICFLFQFIAPLTFVSLKNTEFLSSDVEISGFISMIAGLIIGGVLFEKMLRAKNIYVTDVNFWKFQDLKNELKLAQETRKIEISLSPATKADKHKVQKNPSIQNPPQPEAFVLKESGGKGWLILFLILISVIIFAITNPEIASESSKKLIPVFEALLSK